MKKKKKRERKPIHIPHFLTPYFFTHHHHHQHSHTVIFVVFYVLSVIYYTMCRQMLINIVDKCTDTPNNP